MPAAPAVSIQDQPRRSLAYMAASALGFSLMAIFVKRLAHSIPHFELVFLRSLINLAVTFALMRVFGERLPRTGHRLLLFRGVAGFGSLTCLFYSLSHLPLAVAMILSWCSPIFVILFSALFLGERLGARSLSWVALAFAGLAVLLYPPGGLGMSQMPLQAIVIGLAGSASAALAYVAVRAATARVGVNTIVFYFVAVSALISLPLALGDFRAPTSGEAAELLAMGLLASFAQFMMTQGYRYAKAGVASTMNLLSAGLSAILGWVLFDERLVAFQWAGMITLMGAIVLLTRESGVRRVKS